MAECLPSEVLSKIFAYLCFSDKLQCNLVCRSWRWAYLNPSLHERSQLVYDDQDDLLRRGLIENGLLESDIIEGVRSLKLRHLSVSLFSLRPLTDWTRLLSKLKCLVLEEAAVVNETELVLLLKQCVSLNSFSLNCAREVFISGGFLSNEEDQKDITESLQNVHQLDLSFNSPYLTDRLFNRIVKCLPNVRKFSIAHTKILSHSGIYKKYYPESVKDFNSPSVLTWRNILRFLTERQELITHVNFFNSGLSSDGFQELGNLNHLKLISANVGKCSDIGQEAFLRFLEHQPHVQHLNIDECRKILVDHPEKSLTIFQRMCPDLKTLSMKGLSVPKGMSSCLAQIENLKEFDVSFCDIPSQHVLEGLHSNKSVLNSLQILKMNSFAISGSEKFADLAYHLHSLVKLELKNGHEGVTDKVLTSIISTCHQLEELNLSNCSRLTDMGFTGLKLQDDCDDDLKDQSKIFLGSKAEAELREDIRRMEYIASVPKTSFSKSFRGIGQLKRLRRLDIENLRISEASLKTAFHFKDLRYINLSLCKSVASDGFASLAMANPNLEVLIAKQCNIDNDSFMSIIKHCPRMTNLDVEACLGITDTVVQTLPIFCPNLRLLDVSFCRKVRVATIEHWLIKQIPSLRHIGIRGLALAEAMEDYDDDSHETENGSIKIMSVPAAPPLPPNKR